MVRIATMLRFKSKEYEIEWVGCGLFEFILITLVIILAINLVSGGDKCSGMPMNQSQGQTLQKVQ